MGPLITQEIISQAWNPLLAFLIGIGFGFTLEQAGFSSSRKLVGIFYGYDFVVLRVFFTAVITAVAGLIYFNAMGWIDLNLLFVNSTYLHSAISGGMLIGMGIIIGGFCPGTSLAAAAIGKIDAWFLVGGIFIGTFIFGEFYPLLKNWYIAGALGKIKIYDTLGIPVEFFASALIIIAVLMFYASTFIQKKFSRKENKY